MGDFRQHAEEAKKHFYLIRHRVEQILDGFLVSTERPELVSGFLDRHAGIDALLTGRAEGLYGVAIRIQKTINYRSFTIRKERETGAITEYEKYLKAVQNGCFAPTITVQAYVDTQNGTVLSGGVALTADIYDYIEKYPDEVKTKTTGSHNTGLADFLPVYFDKFKEKGYWIEVF
jgi:hypothetical protein